MLGSLKPPGLESFCKADKCGALPLAASLLSQGNSLPLWCLHKKLTMSTFLMSRMLLIVLRFIITCLWLHPHQLRPMNTDNVLQKGRLWRTEPDRVGGEGSWCVQWPSPSKALGQLLEELSSPWSWGGLWSKTLAFCFIGYGAPLGRRNTQPMGWHFIYITSLVESFWRTRGGRGIPSLYSLGYSLKFE